MLLRSELAFEAGDWAAAEAALPSPGRPAMGTTFINDALRRIELALGRGEHDVARALLDQACDVAADTREPQWIGPLGSLRAELERRTGDLDAARSGDRRRAGPARLLLAGRRADGPRGRDRRARRGRRRRPRPRPRRGPVVRDRQRGRADRARRGVRRGRPAGRGRVLRHRARRAVARATGDDDPDLWTAAVGGLGGARAPLPRRAGAAAQGRGAARPRRPRVGGVAAPPRRSPPRRTIGAEWLASEIEGFALRARLRLEPDESSPAPALTATDAGEDPFGLTPRERQVLALLADGRTNREIGTALYMAEKTASVHVSRILSKLDVRSRTEAAALAHRVGLV